MDHQSSLPPPGGSLPPPGGSLPPPGGALPPPGAAQPPPPQQPAPQQHAPWEPAPEPQSPGLLRSILEARASYAFLAAVLVVFFMCARDAGVGIFGLVPLPEEVVRKYGAYHYHDVRDNGEWWRFFSSLFVSRLGLDALIYLIVFAQVGPQLERVLGTARFCVMYLGAGAGGLALAELIDPSVRMQLASGDTIVAVYAAMGAMPGVVLGTTGSVLATIRSPVTRSALFMIAFWTIARYFLIQRLEPAVLGAAALGLPLGFGLALSLRNKAAGALASAVPLVAVAVLIGLVGKGLRYRDGELVDRGRPATGRLPGPATDDAPRASTLETPAASSKAVAAAREKARALLDRHGPLPAQFGYTLDDQNKAAALLAELTKVVDGPNVVLGELDAERVRLHIIRANFHEAARLAEEHLTLQPGPYARALAGLTAYYKPDLSRAEDHLERATRDAAFLLEVPEALYFYGRVLEDAHGLDAAASHYQRYVRQLGDGRHPDWRRGLVEDARRRLGR
ncbi:MAG: rhomboid family intramembrane serine protease [Planctomycetes bacterium]|nr:rhomboid family intramembrane serine protease [Planctomycetota bacterium]